MNIYRLITAALALWILGVSIVIGQTREETASRLLVEAAKGTSEPSRQLDSRRLLSVLLEDYPETAAARLVASGSVNFPGLPDSPEWHQILVKTSVITGFEHGQFPSYGNATHPGFDIGLPGSRDCGIAVLSPLAGKIVRVVAVDVPDEELAVVGITRERNNRDFSSNTGNAVVLRHNVNNSVIYSLYLHLRDSPANETGIPWRVGMTIPAGSQIGKVGETGAAEGCHLHFESRRFEGIYKYLHPAYGNIYPPGDISNTDIFVQDWIDPEVFLRRAFLAQHLDPRNQTATYTFALPPPVVVATQVETATETLGNHSEPNGLTQSHSRLGNWAKDSEPRRIVRPGQTVGVLSVAADGSTRYLGELLFSATIDPSATDVRLFPSPDATKSIVMQWNSNFGGVEAALIDLRAQRIVWSTLVPEPHVMGRAEASFLGQPILPVTWSPDSRYAAFLFSLPKQKTELWVIDAETGLLAVLQASSLVSGQRSLPNIDTLRWEYGDVLAVDFDFFECSNISCSEQAKVDWVSELFHIDELLTKSATAPTQLAREWTSAIVHPGGYGRTSLKRCILHPDSSVAAIDCLRQDGASPETLRFAQQRISEGDSGPIVPVDFMELGQVDLAFLDIFTMNEGVIEYFVNTSPKSITYPMYPEENLSALATRGEARAISILERYPNASAWKPFVGGMRILPSGHQRFSTVVYWTDYCRACPIIGYNVATLEFDEAGEVYGYKIIGLLDNTGLSGKYYLAYGVEDLRSQPKLVQFFLNLRGYDAGAMDGVMGLQSRAALAEFQRENGINFGTGETDTLTLAALVENGTMFTNGRSWAVPVEGYYLAPAGTFWVELGSSTTEVAAKAVANQFATAAGQLGILDGVYVFETIDGSFAVAAGRLNEDRIDAFEDFRQKGVFPINSQLTTGERYVKEIWHEDPIRAPQGNHAISRSVKLTWGGNPQGVVGSFLLDQSWEEMGLLLTLRSAQGQHNPNALWNAVDSDAKFRLRLIASARRDCVGCRPEGSYETDSGLLFENNFLTGPDREMSVLVPNSVLERNDKLSIGLVSSTGIIFITDTDLDIATLLHHRSFATALD